MKSIEMHVVWALTLLDQVPERDFVKLVSCILQNSVKFTRDAMITIQAEVDPPKLSLVITFRDNGPGIDSSFQARVFEPFSREDTSITRQREGLGLGLAVAKGIAEKLGGSLDLARTDTSGPHRGSVCDIPARWLRHDGSLIIPTGLRVDVADRRKAVPYAQDAHDRSKCWVTGGLHKPP